MGRLQGGREAGTQANQSTVQGQTGSGRRGVPGAGTGLVMISSRPDDGTVCPPHTLSEEGMAGVLQGHWANRSLL